MCTHPCPDDFWCEGVCRFGEEKYSLHPRRGGGAEQSAEVARVADLIENENEMQRIWNRE